MSDGTFGRVLDCKNLRNNKSVALKILRPIEKYIKSAKLEVEVLKDINNDNMINKYYVNMVDCFYFNDKLNIEYFAIAFEKLGHDLLYYIKKNNYYGRSTFNIFL